ncbi:MAG: HAD hydrolase-like protein [Polyangiaceae bacterium]
MYRLVIFDFDGTLADSAAWVRSVLNDVARRYRFRVLADHEFDELRGKDTRAILAHLGVSTWKLPFIARHMRARVARDAHLIQTFPGVRELLADLPRRQIVTAIVSSNAEANVRTILGAETAAHIRHFACGAGLFGKRSKFRDVLRASGIQREHAIAIGDEVRDIEAAAAERIAAGAVTWGYATGELLRAKRPNELFESLDDVRRLLLGAP